MVYNSLLTIKQGTWTFISMKYNESSDSSSTSPGEIVLYVNNIYQKYDNWSSISNTRIVHINSNTALDTQMQVPMIGGYQNGDYFDGKIDDLRFYETDLLDEDIQKIYYQRIRVAFKI